MARRIDTVEARTKLPARRAPYWIRLLPGCSVGFRKLAAGSAGTWMVRVYEAATQGETWRSIGSFEELPAHERYAAAKKAAEALAEHVGKGGSTQRATVRDVCEHYVEAVRSKRGDKAADDAAARFERYVLDDARLAATPITKLTPAQVTAWRRRLAALPVAVRGTRRSESSLNRDMTCFRAALNLARADRLVIGDDAWREALKPVPGADRHRDAYLTREQRSALIQHSPADLAAFLRGLALVPLRPGALAALTVGSLDRRNGVVKIGTDKAGADRKIMLPPATLAFFAEQCANKLPSAPLFARADGKGWDKDAWKKPIKAAAAAGGLPAELTAYSLSHSVITDLIAGGLDVLTVARLSGTSIAMIDKHYGHLRAQHAADALAKLAL